MTAVASRMLKLRFADLVERAGKLEAAAAFCRVGKSTLARYGSLSPADAECYAPVDVVRDLETLVGEPLVTTLLCQLMGGTFVALPETTATGADLLKLLGRQSQRKAALTATLCEALADGRVDRAEAGRAVAMVDEVIAVAAAMRAELNTIVEG